MCTKREAITMKKLIIITILLSSHIIGADAPPQARLVLNLKNPIDRKLSVYSRFVFPNLVDSCNPRVWLGVTYNFGHFFKCSGMVGRTFQKNDNTWIISAFPVFKFRKGHVWNEIDYNFSYRTIYSFTEIRYYFAWFRIGIENENVYNQFYSVGPAIDFVFGKRAVITCAYFFKWVGSTKRRFFRVYLKII
jgi:hypothetical protein